MRRNQHPLPPRPGNGRSNSGTSSNAATSSNANYGYTNNAAGGYGGYGNASGGYAFPAAGGYPYNASGGYPAYANYGYAAGNASGGYPAYGAYAAYGQQPQQAWRNCSHAGCSFAGPGDQMASHEASHTNPNSRAGKIDWSAFAPAPAGQRSEEEEAAARRLGGGAGRAPMIPGTGIRLETEEDVQKWIEERKKKFPTKERAKEKVSTATCAGS